MFGKYAFWKQDEFGNLFRNNNGYVPASELISNITPSTYLSRLPLKEIYSSLSANKIAVQYSKDAGDYVCNYLFYNLMVYGENIKKNVSIGFIHLPPISNKFPLEKLEKTIIKILERTIEQNDMKD